MKSLDMNRLMVMNHEELTEQDKEELYTDIVNFNFNSNISYDNTQLLFRIAQQILKFKGEQVDSLVIEIDKLATRQGVEEAERYQSLLDEIELLQQQVLEARKFDNLSVSEINGDSLHEELVKVQLKNDNLVSELKAKERDLLNEKMEVEKLSNEVMTLEREKGELRNELSILQRESIQQQETRLQAETSTISSSKHRDLIHTIRHKNKHITQLLADIESLEKENNSLKLKIACLQSELEEQSLKVNSITAENSDLIRCSENFQERIHALEQQNDAFKNQLVEMADNKKRRDEQLDQLGIALDARLSQWQDLLVEKDTELVDLKKKLTQLSTQFPNSYMDSTRNHLASMAQSLECKESQIEELQQQIQQALVSIAEKDSTIIELKNKLKSRSDKKSESPRYKRIKQELLETQSRLKLLEARVKDAENDAEGKAEEITDMVIQLREYETGVFGLPEAMDQIKELQKQKKVRDRHIEQLIQAGNQLQSDANALEEENLALRERLGLDVDDVVRMDGILSKYRADQKKLDDITKHLEATNDMNLTLKVQNKTLKKTIAQLKLQLKSLGFEPEIVSSEDDSTSTTPVITQNYQNNTGISEETRAMLLRETQVLENKLQDVIDENEALRKGMHEILDSVRSHDGSSTVQIESTCLERLLEALDSRHISGWYHPAMRLQAQLNLIEGHNAALREQLRITRHNEQESSAKLHQALIQIDVLQSEIQSLQITLESMGKSPINEEKTTPQHVTAEALHFIENLKAKKYISRQNVPLKMDVNTKLEEELTNISKKLAESEQSLLELKEFYESDKESWQNVRKGLQNEIDNLNEKVAKLSTEVMEYASNWDAIEKEPDEVKSILAKTTIRLAALSSENEKLKRKCNVIQELELQLKNDKNSIQANFDALKTSTSKQTKELSREKGKLQAELVILQKLHSECVSTAELQESKQKLNQLTLKYRELLTSKTNMEDVNSKLINQLQSQIGVLQKNVNNIFLFFETAEQDSSDSKRNIESQIENRIIRKDIKDHAEKMYNLLKDQLKESEDHCKDLENQLAAMVQQNLQSQLVEAELRDLLVDSVSNSQLQEAKKQTAYYEKLVVELKAEHQVLQDIADSANENVKAMEELRHFHDYQHDSLLRQVLELTAASEDKVTIGRLTRELIRAQQSEITSSKQIQDLENEVEKLKNLASELQIKLNNVHIEHLSEKREIKKKYRWLVGFVSELHQRYLGHLSILSADTFQSMLTQANFEKTNALALVTSSLNTDKIIEMFKEKCSEVQGYTSQKLQELKLKLQCQSLESKLTQTEGQLQRIEKLCSILQDELLNQENSWEKKQLLWEQTLIKSIAELDVHYNNSNRTETLNEDAQDELSKSIKVVLPINTPELSEKSTMTSLSMMPDSNETSTVVMTENMSDLSNQLNQVTLMKDEQSKKLKSCEMEITELGIKVESFKNQLAEKERKIKLYEKELLDVRASFDSKNQIEHESTEILALKATVASLQNIVNQKEETIGRYQTLLQECRDEHSKTVANLQEELITLQQTLDKKDTNSIKEKIVNVDTSSAMKVILERYLARVHQLEDDLTQCRERASRLVMDLSASQQQTEKWTHTAEERLKTIQEMKQRLDIKINKDNLTDSNSDIIEKSTEIEELNNIIYNLRAKLESKGAATVTRERLRGELDRSNKRLDVVQNQNSELKAEIQRLRKQLTLRQSSTPKSDTVSTAREEVLQKKIKSLEEQISEYQAMIQRNKELHKLKCDEEFGKWEETKRWQATNEKLKLQLKEKTNQVEVLRGNLDRLKDTILRLEKEKITLEGKLKMLKVPNVSQSLVSELERDRIKLQDELKAVRLYNQMKSPESSTLSDVIDAQERKAVTPISSRGEGELAENNEKLLETKNRLQQQNLRLEAQNLELKMQLEKYHLNDPTPRDSCHSKSETESAMNSPKGKSKFGKNRAELERAVVVLKRVVEKLQAENKKLQAERINDIHSKGYVESLQIELQTCQENYLDAVDRCSALEEELKQCKEKFNPLQSDDLAEELAITKTQLAQKCQLLSKVKVLLENAVVREKSLKEQVQVLEKLVRR